MDAGKNVNKLFQDGFDAEIKRLIEEGVDVLASIDYVEPRVITDKTTPLYLFIDEDGCVCKSDVNPYFDSSSFPIVIKVGLDKGKLRAETLIIDDEWSDVLEGINL